MTNRKLLVLGLTLAFVFSTLVACSKENEEKTTTENATTVESGVTTENNQGTTGNGTEVPTTTETQTEAPVPGIPAEFEDIIVAIYEDGLISTDIACVVKEGNTIFVDITSNNTTYDIVLIKDEATGVYTLKLDMNFEWLPGCATQIDGKDTALYNKELLLATLSLVSSEPQKVFDRIDMDFHSAWGLTDTEWETVGDCSIISVYGDKEYFQYSIKKN